MVCSPSCISGQGRGVDVCQREDRGHYFFLAVVQILEIICNTDAECRDIWEHVGNYNVPFSHRGGTEFELTMCKDFAIPLSISACKQVQIFKLMLFCNSYYILCWTS